MRQRKLLNNGFIRLDGVFGETLPVDQVVFRFHIKCPIFLSNIWVFGTNGMFTKIHTNRLEFYTPAYFYDKTGGILSNSICNELATKFQNFHIWLYNFYRKLSDQDILQTQTSMLLPQTLFNEFFWTVSAGDLRTFLKSRPNATDPQEFTQYTNALQDLYSEHITINK